MAPRLDSPWLVAANVFTAATFVAVLVIALRRRSTGDGPTFGGWMCILVNVAIAGIYLPIGPVAWLVAHTQNSDRTGLAKSR